MQNNLCLRGNLVAILCDHKKRKINGKPLIERVWSDLIQAATDDPDQFKELMNVQQLEEKLSDDEFLMLATIHSCDQDLKDHRPYNDRFTMMQINAKQSFDFAGILLNPHYEIVFTPVQLANMLIDDYEKECSFRDGAREWMLSNAIQNDTFARLILRDLSSQLDNDERAQIIASHGMREGFVPFVAKNTAIDFDKLVTRAGYSESDESILTRRESLLTIADFVEQLKTKTLLVMKDKFQAILNKDSFSIKAQGLKSS